MLESPRPRISLSPRPFQRGVRSVQSNSHIKCKNDLQNTLSSYARTIRRQARVGASRRTFISR